MRLLRHAAEPNLPGVRHRLPPALQIRDFSLLWSSLLTNGLASQMLAVAIGWQVYAIRRNPLDLGLVGLMEFLPLPVLDRKSTRLNSSHGYISYAVFCLKKKKKSY